LIPSAAISSGLKGVSIMAILQEAEQWFIVAIVGMIARFFLEG
jgi:hypothetical protein